MSVRVKGVENLKVVGCESDDARGGVRKRGEMVCSWEDRSLTLGWAKMC